LLSLICLQRDGAFQLVAPLFGLQKVVLNPLPLFTVDRTRGVLIRYLINNDVKIFTVNRITQQPKLDLFFQFILETAE
jgi:hypothetical protein